VPVSIRGFIPIAGWLRSYPRWIRFDVIAGLTPGVSERLTDAEEERAHTLAGTPPKLEAVIES
jgi:hypothetical protein